MYVDTVLATKFATVTEVGNSQRSNISRAQLEKQGTIAPKVFEPAFTAIASHNAPQITVIRTQSEQVLARAW